MTTDPPTIAGRLPEFPWDTLEPAAAIARAHPDGIVDLSVGTPVDSVPASVRRALAAAADSPGYPLTKGTAALREAAANWLGRRHGVTVGTDAILPVIGTKEFIAGLPVALGLGPADAVMFPELAYPTYEVGARLAGAVPVAADLDAEIYPEIGRLRLAWVNSPANPTGRVAEPERLAAAVARARSAGAILASDECYIDLGFEAKPASVLRPDICGGSQAGLLGVFSLSKRSNLAGYRAGFVAGDPDLIASLLQLRRHVGLMLPGPIQAAMAAALDDDAAADAQFERYAARRAALRPALERAGWRITHSLAGLYLWASHPDLDCWESVTALARLGVLVAPGVFYGPAGGRHVRVALTAPDERIAAAVTRLAALG